MSSVQQLINSRQFSILNLVGGENGIYRKINGINVVESEELTMFCRPNELVVTTGVLIANQQQSLENLIQLAYNRRTAGFIINTGPYIQQIPESIIDFANTYDFPLFQMDWEYRVTDLLKHTFQFITTNQIDQSYEDKIMNRLLFHYKHHTETLAEDLDQLGYSKDAELGIITCTTTASKNNIERYIPLINRVFQKRYKRTMTLKHRNHFIFLIDRTEVQTPQTPFSKAVEEIYEQVIQQNGELDLIIGMGNFYQNLSKLQDSYDESLTVIQLAQLHNNRYLYKHKEIGAYKIIMGVQDRPIIEKFRLDMLGRLYQYDDLHGTDLVTFLRIYLEENGSTNKVSELQFIHRNTVLYKVNKISMILDIDLSNAYTKTNLLLAFLIEDVLKRVH